VFVEIICWFMSIMVLVLVFYSVLMMVCMFCWCMIRLFGLKFLGMVLLWGVLLSLIWIVVFLIDEVFVVVVRDVVCVLSCSSLEFVGVVVWVICLICLWICVMLCFCILVWCCCLWIRFVVLVWFFECRLVFCVVWVLVVVSSLVSVKIIGVVIF